MSSNKIKQLYAHPKITDINCILHQWNDETEDFNDYMEFCFGNIHYKLINELLILFNKYNLTELPNLLINYKEKEQLKPLLINEFTEICIENGKKIDKCLFIHFKNIKKLYASIKAEPDLITYITSQSRGNIEKIKGKDLHLYRGFHGYSDNFFDT